MNLSKIIDVLVGFVILGPLFSLILTASMSRFREKLIARIAIITSLVNFVSAASILILFWFQPQERLLVEHGVLVQLGSYQLRADWVVDKLSLTYSLLASYFATIIANYSRYYLHREPRYRAFFVLFHLFVFGLQCLSFGGNFQLLFAGWEFVGIASFLLIAFYNERSQPVSSSLYVLGIYRLCDLGLIFASILAHDSIGPLTHHATWAGFGLLLAACGKSAQFPFSGWLRRAMEGPTPSSAVFYGALSVHAGVFLLLRAWPLIEPLESVRWAMATVGILTALLATGTGRTESNIKAQIAWAAITQVGIMFVEIALGWVDVALIHLSLNAALRCYQLLVSPSAVAALLREQSSLKAPSKLNDWSVELALPQRLQNTLYVAMISQSYMETVLNFLVVRPFQNFAQVVSLPVPQNQFRWPILATVSLTPAICGILNFSPFASGLMSFVSIVVIFGSHKSSRFSQTTSLTTWLCLAVFQMAMGAQIWVQHEPSGLAIAHILIVFVLALIMVQLQASTGGTKKEVLALLSTLVIAGYPVGIAFITEDLLVHHFLLQSFTGAIALGLSWSLAGWLAIRCFADLEWA